MLNMYVNYVKQWSFMEKIERLSLYNILNQNQSSYTWSYSVNHGGL